MAKRQKSGGAFGSRLDGTIRLARVFVAVRFPLRAGTAAEVKAGFTRMTDGPLASMPRQSDHNRSSGGNRGGARVEAEAVGLADHGILGDAEAPPDFRRGGASLPQTAQLFDEGRGPNRRSDHCAPIFGVRIECLLLYIVMVATNLQIKKKRRRGISRRR